MGGAMGGYGAPAPMNNFGGNPMGAMNSFGGGGFNRGGMMNGGMRGGGMQNRGGRGGNMGMNNMGAMNMPMGGNMMSMGGGMMGGNMGVMGGSMGMMGGMGRLGAVPACDTPFPLEIGKCADNGFDIGAPGGFGAAQPHFNPAFFNQAQQGGGGDGNWNPHGAKRPRPE
jgi:hypothetical protein